MIRRLKNKISHLFHPVQGEMWCLHRVVEQRSEYPSNRELELTPAFLEALILQRQREGFAFVSIDTLLDSQSVFPQKRVNITFDDGFRDVYQNAYPLFLKYRIPFTIFLTTDFPEGKADVWWIQLEQGRSVEDFERLMKQVYASGKPMADVMHALTGTSPDLPLGRSLALSWPELREMVDSGLCTIGSHTVSHPGLTRIGAEACRQELEASRQIIKDRLGLDAVHLSYPHSMEDDAVRKMMAEAGYVSAALGYGGSIRKGDDKYRLHRKFIVQE